MALADGKFFSENHPFQRKLVASTLPNDDGWVRSCVLFHYSERYSFVWLLHIHTATYCYSKHGCPLRLFHLLIRFVSAVDAWQYQGSHCDAVCSIRIDIQLWPRSEVKGIVPVIKVRLLMNLFHKTTNLCDRGKKQREWDLWRL